MAGNRTQLNCLKDNSALLQLTCPSSLIFNILYLTLILITNLIHCAPNKDVNFNTIHFSMEEGFQSAEPGSNLDVYGLSSDKSIFQRRTQRTAKLISLLQSGLNNWIYHIQICEIRMKSYFYYNFMAVFYLSLTRLLIVYFYVNNLLYLRLVKHSQTLAQLHSIILNTFCSVLTTYFTRHQVFSMRWWCNGQHSCLPSSWSGFDSRSSHFLFIHE